MMAIKRVFNIYQERYREYINARFNCPYESFQAESLRLAHTIGSKLLKIKGMGEEK